MTILKRVGKPTRFSVGTKLTAFAVKREKIRDKRKGVGKADRLIRYYPPDGNAVTLPDKGGRGTV